MITLKNDAGITKTVKVGFSFTVFFFGFFVPLFRGDWKWAGIMAISSFVAAAVTYGIGAWVVLFIFAIKYNEWHINDLKEKGYRVV